MPPPGGKNKEAEKNFANFMTSTAGGTTSPSTGGIGPAGMGGASFTPQSDPTGPGFTTPSDTTIPSQDNNNNNQTGSGATGGTGSSQGAVGSGITNLAGITAAQKFLGTRQPGLDGLIQDNLETYGLTGNQNINDLTKLDPPNIDTDNSSIINNLKNKLEGWKQVEIGDNTLSLEGSLNNPKLQIERPIFWGGTGSANVDTQGNWGFNATWPLGGNKAKGGPVGLMSLPQGYAAGGPVGVDPSDWRIIQQIIAAGGNPEDYVNYKNGGFVDPTADGGWIDRLSRWWYGDDDPENDYLTTPDERKGLPPSDNVEPYDPDNPNHFMIPEGMEDMDIKDILEQMKSKRFKANNGGAVDGPYMGGPQAKSRPPTPEEKYIEDYLESLQQPPTAEVPMEKKPFGGTRENIMDHIEAFDNAPHHMEEPMVGMYGERVPLTLARRVQKYMEGLDPVKRNMIQETLNMFQMKKRMEEMEELNENSGFFGPIPNEYEA